MPKVAPQKLDPTCSQPRKWLDVPVEHPTKSELVINLKAAKALGSLNVNPPFQPGAIDTIRATNGHRALGHFWSVSLDVREQHALVTDGIYRYVRHPMYAAFWLWAIAQALLLPNWVAGFAAMIGFGVLFFGRLPHEEQLMLKSFGDDYRKYMDRTYRLVPGIY
jgi:Isoprenylcysteine carboxyl methyltransferase (ICMT) family